MGLSAVLVIAAYFAQTAPTATTDTQFVALAERWQKAWNSHNMTALADLVDEDVDFITGGGRWLRGRDAFTKHHTQLHQAGAADSTFEIRKTHVQRLTSDIVLMHVEWTVRGDRNPDGTPRNPSRDGVFTWVLTKSEGRWRVRASQNTNITIPPSAN